MRRGPGRGLGPVRLPLRGRGRHAGDADALSRRLQRRRQRLLAQRRRAPFRGRDRGGWLRRPEHQVQLRGCLGRLRRGRRLRPLRHERLRPQPLLPQRRRPLPGRGHRARRGGHGGRDGAYERRLRRRRAPRPLRQQHLRRGGFAGHGRRCLPALAARRAPAALPAPRAGQYAAEEPRGRVLHGRQRRARCEPGRVGLGGALRRPRQRRLARSLRAQRPIHHRRVGGRRVLLALRRLALPGRRQARHEVRGGLAHDPVPGLRRGGQLERGRARRAAVQPRRRGLHRRQRTGSPRRPWRRPQRRPQRRAERRHAGLGPRRPARPPGQEPKRPSAAAPAEPHASGGSIVGGAPARGSGAPTSTRWARACEWKPAAA